MYAQLLEWLHCCCSFSIVMPKFCSECGHSFGTLSAKFCPDCGTAVNVAVPYGFTPTSAQTTAPAPPTTSVNPAPVHNISITVSPSVSGGSSSVNNSGGTQPAAPTSSVATDSNTCAQSADSQIRKPFAFPPLKNGWRSFAQGNPRNSQNINFCNSILENFYNAHFQAEPDAFKSLWIKEKTDRWHDFELKSRVENGLSHWQKPGAEGGRGVSKLLASFRAARVEERRLHYEWLPEAQRAHDQFSSTLFVCVCFFCLLVLGLFGLSLFFFCLLAIYTN